MEMSKCWHVCIKWRYVYCQASTRYVHAMSYQGVVCFFLTWNQMIHLHVIGYCPFVGKIIGIGEDFYSSKIFSDKYSVKFFLVSTFGRNYLIDWYWLSHFGLWYQIFPEKWQLLFSITKHYVYPFSFLSLLSIDAGTLVKNQIQCIV